MIYRELFDKDMINQTFNNSKLLHVLFDQKLHPIEQEIITVKKGEFLFLENEIHDSIYLVAEGLIIVWKSAHVIHIVGKREFVGLDSILANEKSFFSAEALGDAILWRFSKEEVVCKLMNLQEGIFYLYSDLKTVNVRLLQKKMLQRKNSKIRILSNMIQLGKKYGEESPELIKLPSILNKRIIANYSNANHATMSVACRELTNDSILEETPQLVINKTRVKKPMI
ncbi:Crp/Fnr family transcriptional regulator [Listeria monocytogenes]|nr:Crp/Fnr family transcriptional regulator [Listeria monocytogenes]EAD4869073.1 Crp/Fnr family transcriptional regulator [Listeria monocytogenes]EAH0494106.1 Crp/Fnr family transcriptional regulator [Listeria monocytogenes]